MSEVGIDPTPPPDLQGALSQISGNGTNALQSLQEDQAKLEGSNQDLANIPAFDPNAEQQSAPQINRNGVMATMPMLIGLAALGGKVAGIHPRVMLNSVNGMTKGLIQGNQQYYTDAKAKYDDAYQKYMDKYKQQFQIYKEMQQVYKGQVNADLKALEISLRATGYQGKVDQETLKAWQWTQDHTLKLQNAEETKRSHMANEATRAASAGLGTELLDPDTLKLAVAAVKADPNQMKQFVPSMGKAGMPQRNQINAAIAQDLKGGGHSPEQLVQGRALSKAEATSIGKLVGQKNAIAAFETVAKFNGDRVLQLLGTLDNSDIPIIAAGERMALRAGGSADAAEFSSVLNSFQTECARVLNNPTMAGVLSDSARHELQDVVSGKMSGTQLMRVIPRIHAEMESRKSGLAQEIAAASSNLNPLSSAPAAKPGDPGQERIQNNSQPIKAGSILNGKRVVQTGTNADTGDKVAKLEDGSVVNIP